MKTKKKSTKDKVAEEEKEKKKGFFSLKKKLKKKAKDKKLEREKGENSDTESLKIDVSKEESDSETEQKTKKGGFLIGRKKKASGKKSKENTGENSDTESLSGLTGKDKKNKSPKKRKGLFTKRKKTRTDIVGNLSDDEICYDGNRAKNKSKSKQVYPDNPNYSKSMINLRAEHLDSEDEVSKFNFSVKPSVSKDSGIDRAEESDKSYKDPGEIEHINICDRIDGPSGSGQGKVKESVDPPSLSGREKRRAKIQREISQTDESPLLKGKASPVVKLAKASPGKSPRIGTPRLGKLTPKTSNKRRSKIGLLDSESSDDNDDNDDEINEVPAGENVKKKEKVKTNSEKESKVNKDKKKTKYCSEESEHYDSVNSEQSKGSIKKAKKKKLLKINPFSKKSVVSMSVDLTEDKMSESDTGSVNLGEDMDTQASCNHGNQIVLPRKPWKPKLYKDPTQLDEEFMTVGQLYNRLNDGQLSPYLLDPSYILILDARDKEKYTASHIITAFHYTELDTSDFIYEDLSAYTIILVYDDNGLTYSLTDSPLSKTFQKIKSKGFDVNILHGGFEGFNGKYPFLCTDQIVHSERGRQKLLSPTYPSEIVEGKLYLGKGDQATNEKVVKTLKLTHILNIGSEHDNAFPDDIQYYNVRVPDENSSNLYGRFVKMVSFMHSGLEEGGKVLVHCNLGASRSATAIIAYFMYTRKWSIETAFEYVKARRPVIGPNRGFLKQLSDFEVDLFGSKLTDVFELWK